MREFFDLIATAPLWLLSALLVLTVAHLIWEFVRRWEFEEIACVALKYPDIGVLALPAPARHHHVMWARRFIDGRPSHPIEATQGFLTTQGRFVDRKAGLKIATARGQIIHKHGNPTELYSEDMWETPPEARGYSITHIDD